MGGHAVTGIEDRDFLDSVLKRGEVVRLAMCDTDGSPYLVPMNYGYENGAIYLHSAVRGRKIDILRANPDVWFEITDFVETYRPEDLSGGCSTRYRSVMGRGRVCFVEDHSAKIEALRILMRHHNRGWEGDLPEKVVRKTCVLRVDIESVQGKTHRMS